MIPKQLGLVPTVKQPEYLRQADAEYAAKLAQLRHMPVVVRYFPIVSTGGKSVSDVPVRLLSFVPSVECKTAPAHMRVLVRSSAGIVEEEEEVPSDFDDEHDGTDAKVLGINPNNSGKKTEGKTKRKRMYEPSRLNCAAAGVTGSEEGIRLVSVPFAEYEHLACVMLELPSSSSSANGSGGSVAEEKTYTAHLLQRPLLQLRYERTTAPSATLGADAETESISNNWLSVPTTKFNKRDWKTMDAVENSASGGGGNSLTAGLSQIAAAEEEEAESNSEDNRGEPRKKAVKLELTPSQALAAVRAATAAYGKYTGRLPLAGPMAPPSRLALHKKLPDLSFDSTGSNTTAGAQAQKSALSPSQVGTKIKTTPRTTATTTTPLKPTVSAVAAAQPPVVVISNRACATIAESATLVLEELKKQGQPAATTRELEKLVLKQLTVYADISAKAKDPKTKAEAAKWFRESQTELHQWLLMKGCKIANGNVMFP